MKLTNLDNNYAIDTSFEVRNYVPFEIERIGPTRIYPVADYEMKIKIKANEDFSGEIVELAPMLFKITGKDISRQIPHAESYIREVFWQVDLKAGQTYEINYSFDAPNVSPYIYLLGPLKIGDFQELKRWKIASDATISFVNSTSNNTNNSGDVTLTLSGLGLQKDDLVIAVYSIADNDNVDFNMVETGGTWTEVADLFSNNTYDANLGVYYKKMGATPDSSVTFSGASAGGDTDTSAVAMIFRGVDTTTPMDVTPPATITGLNTMHPDPPSLDHNNPTGVWTVIAGAGATGNSGDRTITFPSGYTTNPVQRSANDSSDGVVGMGYNTSPSDPENPNMMTVSGTDSTSYAWAAVTLALRPAADPVVSQIHYRWRNDDNSETEATWLQGGRRTYNHKEEPKCPFAFFNREHRR